jgi:hypothetical protein
MSLIPRTVARAGRRVRLAFYLACARQDMREQQLQVPSGVWFCEQCRVIGRDPETFVVHNQAHAA